MISDLYHSYTEPTMAVSGCSIIHLAMLGLEVDQVIETARALKAEGVDMIDCSTGGIGGKERPRRMKLEQGFQASTEILACDQAGITVTLPKPLTCSAKAAGRFGSRTFVTSEPASEKIYSKKAPQLEFVSKSRSPITGQ